MNFIVDTNIFIASISKYSKYHWVYDSFLNSKFDISVSNDILMEYQEKILEKYGIEITFTFLQNLLNKSNVHFTNIFYNWNLIEQDPSDNKFVDCYVSANADYLLTEDKHFKNLKNVEFPQIKVIS